MTSIHDSDIPIGSTCRICRGEATDDQPLYHPCKCKGSIKYIHESCLLEWIASKNIDINKSNSTIKCDICHYPFKFSTTYDDKMPEKIPISLLIWTTTISILQKLKIWLTSFLSIVLLGLGIPLAWNVILKIYTSFLHKQHLSMSQFENWFNDNNEITLVNIFENSIIPSYFQILLIITLFIALYFQYDMIVREPVFSKMVYHKIGPQFSRHELLKKQLKERFPMMDDDTIEHLAKLMKEKLPNRDENSNEEENEIPQQQEEEEEEQEININQNVIVEQEQQEHGHLHNHSDEDDPDYIEEEENNLLFSDDDDITDNEDLNLLPNEHPDALRNEHENHNNNNFLPNPEPVHHPNPWNIDIDDMDRQEREIEDGAADVNRHAQRMFDNLIDQHRERNINDVPIPIPQGPQPQEPLQQQQQQPNPQAEADQRGFPLVIINIRLKLTTMFAYYFIACWVISLFLFLVYFVPSIFGMLLINVYSTVFSTLFSGLNKIWSVSNGPIFYANLIQSKETLSFTHNWIIENIIEVTKKYYIGYMNNSIHDSFIINALPSTVTYLTTLSMIYIFSELSCYGFSRENGMKNTKRRLLFQILFAIRCTFKVFVLFFIELLGFPILAGFMLDISLFCPILRNTKFLLWVQPIYEFWPPLVLVFYWGMGTMYMYCFAKYIGMIRQSIIRPGVLFFIRSPEDPNIKILQDSLIHPMPIQISRLALSFFIYAIFILFGFGFFTRLLFPIILNSDILTMPEINNHFFPTLWVHISCLYFSRHLIESKTSISHFTRIYWNQIFKICSRSLRLSSFLLGEDIQTERGHILYRNPFYKFLSPQNAQFSNPELYTDPKTPSQAKELFKTNQNIHAYFIPDGTLMRVPASDIVSRSYVQTMFVPVTKDDKLLKPLDFDKIKKRNKKNAGEFGYLDDQTTEFDSYSVIYSPPSFRSRYIVLIGLIWIFSSILILACTALSQFVGVFILSFLLLTKYIFSNDNVVIQSIDSILGNGISHVNLEICCLGAVVTAQILEGIYNLTKEKEHHVADEHSRIDIIEIIRVSSQQLKELLIGVFESGIFKWHLFFSSFLIFNTIVLIIQAIDLTSATLFGIGYIFRDLYNDMHDPLITSLSNFSRFAPNPISSFLALPVFLQTFSLSYRMFTTYHENRRLPTGRLWTIFWNFLYKKVLIRSLCTTIPIILSWIICITAEYIFYGDHYNSIKEVFIFFMKFRLDPETTVPWTLPQHLCYISTIIILTTYYSRQAYQQCSKWFGGALQNVKDEVYAKGKALENFPEVETVK